MVGFSINDVLLEVTVIFSGWFSLVEPEEIPVKAMTCAGTFSLIAILSNAFNVGGRFITGLTVTLKVRLKRLLLVLPSFTVTVMVAVPLVLLTGLKVNVPVALGLV